MGILVAEVFVAQSTNQRTKKNSVPISFWARHNTPNQSYSELETHTSMETNTDKRPNSQKLHTNRLKL